jgi:hypothetical protein
LCQDRDRAHKVSVGRKSLGARTARSHWLGGRLLAETPVHQKVIEVHVIMLEYINQLRARGYTIEEAAVEGAVLRLRPIMDDHDGCHIGAPARRDLWPEAFLVEAFWTRFQRDQLAGCRSRDRYFRAA